MSPEPHLHINRLSDWSGLAALDTRVRAAAAAALSTEPLRAAEVSITFLPAAEMRRLNAEYHDADAPTDVLAFDLGSAGEASLLGDVYVCPDVALASASAEGIRPSEELLRLVIHGVLHLLGHDHPDGDERYESEMFRLQERLLASLA